LHTERGAPRQGLAVSYEVKLTGSALQPQLHVYDLSGQLAVKLRRVWQVPFQELQNFVEI